MRKVEVSKWMIDEQSNTLINRSGEVRKIGTHELNVLLVLLENVGEVVTSDTLIKMAWPNKIVSKNSLTQAIKNLRSAIEDSAKVPHVIKTVNRVGYLINPDFVTCINAIEEEKKTITVISTKLLATFLLFMSFSSFISSIYNLVRFNYLDDDYDTAHRVYQSNSLIIYSRQSNQDWMKYKDKVETIMALKKSKSTVFLMFTKENVSISIVSNDGSLENYLIIFDNSKESEIEYEILEKIKTGV